jgi:hypothetical protein
LRTETLGLELSELRADLTRWSQQVGDVSGTHCQGIGSKAARCYERLLKGAADWYIATVGVSFEELAGRTHYAGNAKNIERLTLGTVVEFLTALAKAEPRFAELYQPVEASIRAITPLRNDISHPSGLEELRPIVERLLQLIADVTAHDELWRPLIDRLPMEDWRR